MLNNQLIEKLVVPGTNEKLFFSEEKNILNNQDNTISFVVKENVPILLPKNKDELSVTTPKHNEANSDFKYLEHYQKDAEFFDYSKKRNIVIRMSNKRLYQAILNNVSPEHKEILDVGCGRAWVAQKLLAKNKFVCSMDISDVNPIMALKSEPSKNHSAVVADVFNLPFKKKSFDLIIASEIMEHVWNPKLFISNLYSILKPGGRLIITTPYDEKIRQVLCIHCNKLTPLSAHIHSFSEKNIKNYIPTEIEDYHYKAFSNQLSAKMRINVLTAFYPFKLWYFNDKIINYLISKPSRFMIVINKK